jgi:hypothetical protein
VPKESAKSFDDPARDTWQLPDRVMATLNLKAKHCALRRRGYLLGIGFQDGHRWSPRQQQI